MKTKFLFYCLFITFGLLATSSCSSDSDSGSGNPPPAGGSRQVKYEVTGTTAGNFNVTYFTASGAATSETFSSLPWSKEVTIQNGVASINFNIVIAGGTPGQTITGKLYVGGEVKRNQTVTIPANGTTFIAFPSYTF